MKSNGHLLMPSQTTNLRHNLRRFLFLCIVTTGLLPIHLYAQNAADQPSDVVATSIFANTAQSKNVAAEAHAKQLNAGVRTFLVETLDGSSITVPATTTASLPNESLSNESLATTSCGGLSQEAEDAKFSGNFAIGEDTAASGGKYLHTPNGSGNFYNGPVAENRAEFCFTVPLTGTYYIRASTFAADTLNDSFYVQVDGAPDQGYLWDIFPTSTYIIDYVNDRFFADPVELELAPGEHIITIFPREDGARLDTIELQFAQPNSGPVPVCAGLTQEAENGAMQGSFVVKDDPTASGGKYIVSPKGTGSYWYGPNTLQRAKYCFNVQDAGIYRLDARVYGPDLLNDSFYVRIDNPKSIAYLWDTNAPDGFATDSVNHRYIEDPVLLKLPSGPHTVTIYVREDGTQLDNLNLVFTDAYTEPQKPPITAMPISGTIRPDTSGLIEEVDFSEMYVRLIDAETRGKQYSKRVQVDRIGHYQFDGMPPGKYIVVLEIPAIYTSKQLEFAVDASLTASMNVSFDIVLKLENIYLPLIGR